MKDADHPLTTALAVRCPAPRLCPETGPQVALQQQPTALYCHGRIWKIEIKSYVFPFG